jgi:regulatory protein
MAEPIRVVKLFESVHVEGRWYIELSNGESVKGNVALIADFSLYTGRELTEDEYEELKASASRMNAKSRALRILGSRMLSKSELYDKLIEKGEEETDAESAVDYLESLGFINDSEYGKSLVRHYSSRGYGEGRIKNELYRHKVPKELWEDVLTELPEDTDAIDTLIDRRLRGSTPDKKELKRLTDMLMRRGFSWEQIKSALNRYEFSEDENLDG